MNPTDAFGLLRDDPGDGAETIGGHAFPHACAASTTEQLIALNAAVVALAKSLAALIQEVDRIAGR